MAAMTTFALVNSASAHGPVKFTVMTWVGATSYNNTGTPATSGDAGLVAGLGGLLKNQPTILAVIPLGIGSYTYQYDAATDLLRVFTTGTTPAEVTNATDLHTVTFRALVVSY